MVPALEWVPVPALEWVPALVLVLGWVPALVLVLGWVPALALALVLPQQQALVWAARRCSNWRQSRRSLLLGQNRSPSGCRLEQVFSLHRCYLH